MYSNTVAQTNERGDVFDRVRDVSIAIRHIASVLEDVIHHPTTRRDDVVRRSAFVGSSPSWNAQVAYLIFDLRPLVRSCESRLRFTGTNTVQRPRGGSDENTYLALEALPDLALSAGSGAANEALRDLEAWHHRARLALGEVEPMRRVPRQPGAQEPRCPWCEHLTLRCQVHAGLVKCVNPECLDDTGRQPQGWLEIGRTSGEPMLVWRDGTSGLSA